jgi:sec-independent protein translocase protein TatC
MSTTQLYLVAGAVTLLILVPVVVTVLVRLLVKDEQEAPEAEPEVGGNFESIGDFWQGMAPHLRELRDRLVWSFVAIGIATALGFWVVTNPALFGKSLTEIMVEQLAPAGTKLQGIDPAEVFVAYMRIALVVGVAGAMPVVLYQLLGFFAPGLLPNEKRIVFTAVPWVTSLFIAGLTFGWFITAPAAMQFLLGFDADNPVLLVQPRVDTFMSTVATLLLWNGVIFQLPAIIFLLVRLGIVTTTQLARTRRYAIVVITIIAAVITPTGDPFNLMLLAVPMYLLYELGILLSRFAPKKKEATISAVTAS